MIHSDTDDVRLDIEAAANIWHARRNAERTAKLNLGEAIIAAHKAGVSESEAARLARCDRMTVRKILGK